MKKFEITAKEKQMILDRRAEAAKLRPLKDYGKEIRKLCVSLKARLNELSSTLDSRKIKADDLEEAKKALKSYHSKVNIVQIESAELIKMLYRSGTFVK